MRFLVGIWHAGVFLIVLIVSLGFLWISGCVLWWGICRDSWRWRSCRSCCTLWWWTKELREGTRGRARRSGTRGRCCRARSSSWNARLATPSRIHERKKSVTVLLCSTSGCGKSTFSALLGSRLGVTTVVSTDSIHHLMRSFMDKKQNPLLWASTYLAGECLDPVAVAKANAKRKARKHAVVSHPMVKEELSDGTLNEKSDGWSADTVPETGTELIGKKQMAIEGFKAQSEMVIESLDQLITAWEERKESVVVEGVHLSLNFVMGLMKKHP